MAKTSVATKSRPRAAGKFVKDPNAPRRFRSAFVFFSMANHHRIRREHELIGGKKMSTTDTAKMVAKAFDELDSEEKDRWHRKAELDKQRYNVEKSTYTGPWKILEKDAARKHPDAPKRPPSAYLMFANRHRSTVKRLFPNMTSGDISKRLGKMWKTAPQHIREPHIEDARKKLEEYKAQKARFDTDQRREFEARRNERETKAEMIAMAKMAAPSVSAVTPTVDQHTTPTSALTPESPITNSTPAAGHGGIVSTATDHGTNNTDAQQVRTGGTTPSSYWQARRAPSQTSGMPAYRANVTPHDASAPAASRTSATTDPYASTHPVLVHKAGVDPSASSTFRPLPMPPPALPVLDDLGPPDFDSLEPERILSLPPPMPRSPLTLSPPAIRKFRASRRSLDDFERMDAPSNLDAMSPFSRIMHQATTPLMQSRAENASVPAQDTALATLPFNSRFAERHLLDTARDVDEPYDFMSFSYPVRARQSKPSVLDQPPPSPMPLRPSPTRLMLKSDPRTPSSFHTTFHR